MNHTGRWGWFGLIVSWVSVQGHLAARLGIHPTKQSVVHSMRKNREAQLMTDGNGNTETKTYRERTEARYAPRARSMDLFSPARSNRPFHHQWANPRMIDNHTVQPLLNSPAETQTFDTWAFMEQLTSNNSNENFIYINCAARVCAHAFKYVCAYMCVLVCFLCVFIFPVYLCVCVYIVCVHIFKYFSGYIKSAVWGTSPPFFSLCMKIAYDIKSLPFTQDAPGWYG